MRKKCTYKKKKKHKQENLITEYNYGLLLSEMGRDTNLRFYLM